MEIAELLDQAKMAQNFQTDMALAKALGVSRSAVSAWRHGLKGPDPVQAAALAGYTGIPLARVLGIVGEARAISPREKAVWRRLAATAPLLLVGLLGAAHTPAQAAPDGHNSGPKVCIMRNVRWCWNLLGLWLSHRFRRAKPSPGNIEARLPA